MEKPRADSDPLWCTTCGYELTGLPETRCPECGTEFSIGQVREENRQLRVRPMDVCAQFALAPTLSLGAAVIGLVWLSTGSYFAAFFTMLAIVGGVLLSIGAAVSAGRRLARFANAPESNGIGATPSRLLVLAWCLLLWLAACSIIVGGAVLTRLFIPMREWH